MAHRVCPWWLGYLLACPLRRLAQDPRTILEPFVSDGMILLEPGPGMGFFTLEAARMVGARGRVVAVDIQPRMLDGLRRRAEKAQLLSRIELRLAGQDGLGVEDLFGRVDRVLAFAVVHELPDAGRFFLQAAQALKSGGLLLMAEPSGHVSPQEFEATVAAAEAAGLTLMSRPFIRRSHAALFVKGVPSA
ncbi:MAG TPA: methyltransferase domain-containing protein [Anaeromyxobacteraceae bacterium]|nr:methyltransferase domain-containing protein [Anaeromyxobacteraceae bacterium]